MYMLNPFLFVFALIALLTASGCGEEAKPDPVDVASPGMYKVGIRESTITYQPKGLNESRTIGVVVWYPAQEEGRQGVVFGDATVDAPLIETSDFPLLVYSHGTTSFAECAYGLMEHFASHGFVVASAHHFGDTTENVGEARTTEMFIKRPQDISATIDWLYALPSSDPLGGKISDRVILAGHSYGGFNSLATVGAKYSDEAIGECETSREGQFCSTMKPEFADIFREGFNDTRIKAVMPMAAGNSELLGPSGVSKITIPILHMTASLDGNSPNETDGDPYWAAMNAAGSFRVNYDRGGHHSYILTCEVLPSVGDENGGGCSDDFTDYQVLLSATNTYALAFARYHLFEDEQMLPILEGERSKYDEVTTSWK